MSQKATSSVKYADMESTAVVKQWWELESRIAVNLYNPISEVKEVLTHRKTIQRDDVNSIASLLW